MSDIRRDGPALCTIVSGHAQLQAMPRGQGHAAKLEIALNDGQGANDAESGVVSGSIVLERSAVKALHDTLTEFLLGVP